MPDQTKSTTLAGVRYDMKLLGGREAIAAGVLIAGPALRAVDDLISRLNLSDAGSIKDMGQFLKAALESVGLEQLQKAHLPAVAASIIEALGPDGVAVLSDLFAKNTTVFLPSPAAGDTKLYSTPLENAADEHWKGRFPLFMSWLTWGVWANGFFDVTQLASLLPPAKASAASPGPTTSTASPGA